MVPKLDMSIMRSFLCEDWYYVQLWRLKWRKNWKKCKYKLQEFELPEAEMYIPEVDWFDELFGPVVNTKYIKALAVSLVQLTPKAGSTFWPSFSASRSNNAPITPEKAKILVSILKAVYHHFKSLDFILIRFITIFC